MSLPENSAAQPAWAPYAWGPRWSRIVGKVLCYGLWKVEVHGESVVPQNGRSIVAANHSGFIDGPLMMGVMPRPTHFLVKGAFFKGALGLLMRASGQIPVLRGKGKDSLMAGRAVLNREDSLGIFPEGRRGKGDVADLHPGVGWLSLHTDTPVIPAAILGSRQTGASVHAWPKFRARVVVQFGEPVYPTPVANKGDITRAEIAVMTSAVQAAMQKLLVQAQTTHEMILPSDEGTQDHGVSNV